MLRLICAMGYILATITPATAGDALKYTAPIEHYVDGDTFDIVYHDLQIRLRIKSIDTTEKRQPFYEAATRRVRELTGNGRTPVTITFQGSKGGRYNVLVHLPDGRSLGDILVREGYARVWCKEPSAKLRAHYGALMDAAQAEKRGVWGVGGFDFRCD